MGCQLSYMSTCISLQFTLSVKDLNLPEYRLDFLRIVCSHEHYVILNLPLGTLLYPMGAGSQQSSPSGSISSTFENLDMPNVEAMGELSHEFRHFHYLSGLVLSELAQVLVDGKLVLHKKHHALTYAVMIVLNMYTYPCSPFMEYSLDCNTL